MNADKSNDRRLLFTALLFMALYGLLLVMGSRAALAGLISGFMSLSMLVPEDGRWLRNLLLLFVVFWVVILLVGVLWVTGMTITIGSQ